MAKEEPKLQTVRAPSSTISAHGQGFLKLQALETPPAPSSMESVELPPTLHQRYGDITPLGRGGMSMVYKARDRQLGREVALKFLFDNEDTGLRLLREARSQARLNHENACKVYEVGIEDGKRYVVMQYIAGVPFDQLKGRIGIEDKVQIVKCVALALHEAIGSESCTAMSSQATSWSSSSRTARTSPI